MMLKVKHKIDQRFAAFVCVLTLSLGGQAAVAVPDVASEDLGEPGEAFELFEGVTPQEQLDLLFDELANPDSDEDAELTEKTILNLWSQSGSATVDLMMDRASSVVLEGDVELGIGLIDSVLELEAEFAEAWYRRSQLKLMLGNMAGAMEDLQRVLSLEPRHFLAISTLADILHRTGDSDAALSAYRLALEINPHMEEVRKAIADLSFEVEGQGI